VTVIANNPSDTVTVLADAKNSYVTLIDKPVAVGVVAGVQGVAGKDGGATARYIHNQSSPLDTWVINHNMGKYPAITTLTVGLVEFYADVVHVSLNQAIITLTMPSDGIAICS
jgi:hypothetical protein